MALSALHRLHGLEPLHLDFFSRQRSQALHTRFLMPPSVGDKGSAGGEVVLLPMMKGCTSKYNS